MWAKTGRRFLKRLVLLVICGALVGCGGGDELTAPTEKTEIIEETTYATVAQAVADEPKNKMRADWERPTFEVRDVRPATITSTDLSFGNADVFLTDFGGRPYGIMKNDPVLQEIADEIRADNPEYEMMLVSVYSGTEKREDRFMSNWYAFESPAIQQQFLEDFGNYVDEVVSESTGQ